MEALAAVGVASAAVQFLDFSVKTLALCREIRDSSDGSTKANDDLIMSVKRLKAWQRDLQQKCSTTSGAGRRLIETVRACSRIADQLLQLLEHIREVSQKALGTLRAALRALKEGKRIEKMQTQLSDCQAKFHLALTAEMRDSLLESLEAQGKNSESMRVIILQKLEFAHDRLRAMDENVTQTAGETQKHISSLKGTQEKAHASLRCGQRNLGRRLDRQFDVLSISSTHQEFLDRLFFDEMFERQESMKGCSPGTYDSVFSGKLPDYSSQYNTTAMRDEEDLKLRGRILSWLRATDGQPTFWINGKPGSGKTSLMSYIMGSPRTKEHLQHWAGSRTLHVFSVFFWKPGSSLQRTMLGFRRSMLWQLCKSKPSIIDKLLARDSSSLLTPWTQERLIDALRLASSYYKNDAVFCMVDGLDECEDDHCDLLDEFIHMNFGSCAKTCLSSRPEEAIRRRLQRLPSISLQVLNRADIFEYARARLQRGRNRTEYLAHEVAQAAEGVFLWAVLVCDSLYSGLMAEDNAEILLRRLRDYPKGLDELFARMFASVDKFHFESLAFYFYAAKQHGFGIALAVASQPTERIMSFNHFGVLCEREITRLRTQSRGLLEVTLQKHAFARHYTHGWCLRDLPHGKPRERRLEDEEYRLMSRYSSLHIRFVHRSAYDYIFKNADADDDRLPTWARSMNTRDITSKVLNGILWLAEYGAFLHLDKEVSSWKGPFIQDWPLSRIEDAIDASHLRKIDAGQVCTGLSRVWDALCLWESVQVSRNYLDLRDAAEGEEHLRRELDTDDLHLFGEFWSNALMIKPEFVMSNLPRMWDRVDNYANVTYLLAAWANGMSRQRYLEEYDSMHPATQSVMHSAILPATQSAMHSAMTNIRLPGRATASLTEFPSDGTQRCYLYTFRVIDSLEGKKIPQLISWYGASTGIFYERQIVIALRSTAVVLSRAAQRDGRTVYHTTVDCRDTLQIAILEDVCTTISTWQLHDGTCIGSSGRLLPLQLSLPTLRMLAPVTHNVDNVEKYHSSPERPETTFRLSCFARQGPNSLDNKMYGQSFGAVVTYQLSPLSTSVLMHYIASDRPGFAEVKFAGSLSEQSACTKLVMSELWEDLERQLTAWDQLYIRACVRSYFMHFWREKEIE